MKYAWIDEHHDQFSATRMCRLLAVSRSGYCQWRIRPPRDRSRANAALDEQVAAIHAASKRSDGRDRIVQGLRKQGLQVGHERVRESLRRQGLRPVYKRPYRVTTDSNHAKPIAANVLDRRFDGWAVNRALVADITYVASAEGCLYLAVVMDPASRKIVGWSMSDRIRADLVCEALRSAYWRRQPAAGLIMRTDRGGAVRQRSISEIDQGLPDDPIDEPTCELLGQRADGTLLQDAEGRTDPSVAIRDASAGSARRRRLDRRLLQSRTDAFVDRLSDAGGRRIQPHGCVGWCTSN